MRGRATNYELSESKIMNQKDLSKLLRTIKPFYELAVDKRTNFHHINDYFLVLIGSLTGLRVSEICGLKLNMLNQNSIDVIGKGNKKRVVPLGKKGQIRAILKRRELFKDQSNGFVFHIDGKPLNYGTIQINYKKAQRRAGLKCSGTHVLRHGMAKLARRVGGGLDAVIAMTGHKDLKLADHYSKLDEKYNREISLRIENEIKKALYPTFTKNNVIPFNKRKHRMFNEK